MGDTVGKCGPRGRRSEIPGALDATAAVLASGAFVHVAFTIADALDTRPDLEGSLRILVFLNWAIVPCSLVGLAVGFHTLHLERGPSWRRKHRNRILLVGLLATVVELALAGVAVLYAFAEIRNNDFLAPWGTQQPSVEAYRMAVRLGTLLAIGSPVAPFVLFLQTIRALEGADSIQPLLRNAHWMLLAPLVLIYAAILILGLFAFR